MTWLEAALRWYAVLAALTWAFAPGVAWLCARLPDRGASLARPLAMLAAVYPAWLLASAGSIEFGRWAIWLSAAAAAVAGWVVTARGGADLGARVRRLAGAEIASAGLFAAYVWLRGFTPQILGTEKPMDLAFLASSMRAAAMPPPDPWFAGEPINYYYLGYLLHGTVGRLADVPPQIGFNLALATVFSTTVVAAFGVVWNVASPWTPRVVALASSAFAAFLLAIAGNLYAPWRLLQDASTTLSAWWWAAEGIGWRSSRIVCDGPRVGFECRSPATETINEFPFFSFLLGDLHPHLMALPYSLVAIGLAWNLWQVRAGQGQPLPLTDWSRLVLTGAVAGALYPLNAWDLPTYLLLMGLAVWVSVGMAWRSSLLLMAALAAAAILAWLPFHLNYAPPISDRPESAVAALPGLATVAAAISVYLGERTSLMEYLTIFGTPYLFGLAFILAIWRDNDSTGAVLSPGGVAAIGAATVVPGVILSAPVIPLCGVPLALALLHFRQGPHAAPRDFALALFALAWALSIAVELVYIRDAFDDRMNTLFKYYYQTWTLYAVASGVAVAVLWQSLRTGWSRALLSTATAAAVLAGLVYPTAASAQWTERFATWQGIDGLAYAEDLSPDEVAAIRWLGEHAAPGDVVLEAAGCSYYPFGRLPFNRVSAFTGMPTIIGWANHERQWRAGQPELMAAIPNRQADVASIFADPSGGLADTYDVRWLFVGEYEAGSWRAECESAGPYRGIDDPSFPGPEWKEAFRSGETRVYRRNAP